MVTINDSFEADERFKKTFLSKRAFLLSESVSIMDDLKILSFQMNHVLK